MGEPSKVLVISPQSTKQSGADIRCSRLDFIVISGTMLFDQGLMVEIKRHLLNLFRLYHRYGTGNHNFPFSFYSI